MKRDDQAKPVTNFKAPENAPFVDPTVAARNPAAAAYARDVAKRSAGYSEPRGGAPAPPMPPLNASHRDGMTMADNAIAMRQPPPSHNMEGTIFSPEAAAASMAPPGGNAGIMQNDVLPEAARQDPMFRDGHGSAYAINQPGLAKKYGVIRNGKLLPPQALVAGQANASLKAQTVEGLEAVIAFNKVRQSAESGDSAAETAAREGIAGEAAKVAGGDDARPATEEQKKDVERAMQNMDEFDFNAFREIMMKDLVNNEEQRKIVEERIDPLDLSELIMNGRVTQLVPIVIGKYEPTFQSFTGEEELALKRLLMDERKGIEAPDRYLLDKFQLMTVALGISKVNTKGGATALPPHTDAEGNFNDTLFWKKFNRVLKLPFHMLASMGVHYYWFDVRVRKLFVAERLKNG